MEEKVDIFINRLVDSGESNLDHVEKLGESLVFKYNKANYHYGKINGYLDEAKTLKEESFDRALSGIYFEMESLIIAVRSVADVVLHIINSTCELNIDNREVTLAEVFHHKDLPQELKKFFYTYTNMNNNDSWEFIASVRNEIIHEKSMQQIFPVKLEMNGDILSFFFYPGDKEREVTSFFKRLLFFLKSFISDAFYAISSIYLIR